MRIVSFNIQHGRTPGGTVRTDLLAGACGGFDCDLLALQEVDVRVPRSRLADQAAAVARATGMQAVFGAATRVGMVGRYGNALLVRGALADVDLRSLPRLGRGEPRQAILARAAVDGSEASVAATHLSVDKTESEAQLQAVLEALLDRPPPRLLIGDLNRRPGELRLLDVAGFDVADPALPTFPAAAPRLRLDHVAVQAMRVDTVDVLPAATVSDHRPLRVVVAPNPS